MDASLFSDEPQSQDRALWRRLPAKLGSLLHLSTLKARLGLGALLALCIGMAVTAWNMSSVAEAAILRRAALREHIDAQQTAALLGHRIAEFQRALAVSADLLSPASLDDHAQLQQTLNGQPVLNAMFSNLLVAGQDGQIKASSLSSGALPGAAPGTSIAERNYFRRALHSGRAVISEPLNDGATAEPMVVFCQPLKAAGSVWGVLCGSLRLASQDLIGFLAESRDFDDLSQVVITDDMGRILAHPQQASVLQSIDRDTRLAAAAVQWRSAGRPLIGAAGAWPGVNDVVAMAGEPLTGWHVWRVASREELLAPLHEARTRAFRVASVVGTALALMLGLFLAWQLQPLRRLERRAADMLHGTDVGEWPLATGEIGRLSQTLRHVWAERAQVERFNAQVLQKLTSVMSASPVGLAFVRHDGFELFSEEGCRTLGYAESELVGRPAALIFPAGEDYAALREQSQVAFAAGQSYEGEWRLLDAQGAIFWARIRARPVVSGDADAGAIWSLYNIDEQISSRQLLERAALHDGLTGCLNRVGLAVRLAEAFFDPTPALTASVILLDLDHFKAVNDLGGHAAGDAMLQAVAKILTAQVRANDPVARLGGDEFAVLLPNCAGAQALIVAEKIRQGIDALELEWEGRQFRVGCSLGVAERDSTHATVEQWLAAADAACYEAKGCGRNAVRGALTRSDSAGGPPV